MPILSKKRAEYLGAYCKKNYRYVLVSFSKVKDIELLNFLDNKKSKSAYIRALIKADMKKNG